MKSPRVVLLLGLLAVAGLALCSCQHLCPNSARTFRDIGRNAGETYGKLTEQVLLNRVTEAKQVEAYAVWMDFHGQYMDAFKAKGCNWNAQAPAEVKRLGLLFAFSVRNLQNP